MEVARGGFLLLLLLAGVLCGPSGPKKDEQPMADPVGDSAQTTDDSLHEALKSVYKMTNGFINVIQPNNLYEIDDFVKEKIEGTKDIEDLVQDEEFYNSVAMHFIGFIVCFFIGAVLIIAMVLTCAILFCCRCCCGNCGGRVSPHEDRHSKRARLCHGGLLILFNTILLAGCLVMFMSNEMLRKQTSPEPQGLLPQMDKSLESIEEYKQLLFTDLRKSILDEMVTGLDNVIRTLEDSPQGAKDALNTAFNTTNYLTQASGLVTSAKLINSSLVNVKAQTNNLKTSANTLVTQLTDVKTRTVNSINNKCPTQATSRCQALKTEMNAIAVKPDFSSMEDVDQYITNIQSLLTTNPSLEDLVNRGQTEYNKISNEVDQKTDTQIRDVRKETTRVSNIVKDQVDKFEKDLKNDLDIRGMQEDIKSYQDDVETYGNYRWYGGLAIGCIILSIVILYFFGLAFGCAGEPPYDEGSSCCNRGVGAHLFLMSVVLTFLFFWVIMIVQMILFTTGGPLQSEICRNIVDIEKSPSLKTIDRIIHEAMEHDYEFKMATILQGCKNNEPLYKVFNIDQIINITEKLDVKQYNIEAELNKIKTVNINFGNVKILDADTERKMVELADAKVDSVDFDSYYRQLGKPPTEPGLRTVAADLSSLADQVGPSTDLGKDLKQYSQELMDIDATSVAQLNKDMRDLEMSLRTLQAEIDPNSPSGNFQTRITNLVASMKTAESKLSADGNRLVQEFLSNLTITLYKQVEGVAAMLASNLKGEVGRCKPLYNAINTAVVATCRSVLEPWNAFWFATGWCLIFLILCLIPSLSLVTQYRKTETYQHDDKNFDDPNFDAYAGSYPGDNIPLEDNRTRPY